MKNSVVFLAARPRLCALILFNLAGSVSAQQLPDAGALQQQIQRERMVPMPEVVKPLPSAPPGPAQPADGLTVSVSRFEFIGNTLLNVFQLDAAVAPFLQRPLTFAELQAAVAAVADAYRAAGWVVRTFLPQQELAGDVVKIQILEASFGDVVVQPVDAQQILHVEVEKLRKRVFALQQQGHAINTADIDRALLILEDLPGIKVEGVLSVGKVDRETDLILRVENEARLSGEVRLDNTGSISTGRERFNGNLAVASPMRSGDKLDLNLLHTEGSDYGRMAYQFPIGYKGWSAALSVSDMRYHLVGDSFSALQIRGSASTAGLEATYPLLRSRQANLSVNLTAERKNYDNESGGVTTTQYNINAVNVTLNGNRSDAFAGGGSLSGNLVLITGKADFSDTPNFADDAQTAGRFGKLRYFLNRQQSVNQQFSFSASLSGQWGNKNLDSAEKFYLGGAAGVRAYPSSEGGGSEGHLLNLELHARLPHNFSLLGFYDGGRVRVNKNNDIAGAALLNDFSLHGAGLGLAWSGQRETSARLLWARRLGDNPNANAAGKDQDGTMVKDRFWLTLSQAF